MVGHHSPRFSYVRDFKPRMFSYAEWARPRVERRVQSNMAARAVNESTKQAMMVGGAVLGVVAIGALVYIAAKK